MPSLPLPAAPDCQAVELRQYTLHPCQRDTLIELFDREFVDTQEAVGMRVLGQFRDLDDADRFVWLRGFAGMAARGEALPAFYGGPAWAAHRDAANATMVDSDDVLLLRPAWGGAALPHQPRVESDAQGLLRVLVLHLKAPAEAALLAQCQGTAALAWYVSEAAPNNFPRLPLREGEPVLVGLALFSDAAAAEAWARDVDARSQPWQARASQHLRLAPTTRSAIRL
ncbi:MAG: NIPSNAP family protein [Roseateles sp.]|uniref:NIPSNAP family protein n=1 Tax=Roseateles sp. TaxID=1971397 RepID=UPI0040364A60